MTRVSGEKADGRGARCVYMDNAATTYPKPESVYREVERVMREVGGSAGRSGHRRAVETGRVVFAARRALAELFNIPDPLRIAFTKNATEALNTAIFGLLRPGDHVVTSSVEHNSVMRPLERARALGVSYSVAPCGVDGGLDPADLEKELRPETALVVLNQASNLTGTILPVAGVASVTRKRGVPLLVDAAQTAGRLPVDVRADGIDLLAFTGHKELFGPQGTGGLYIREGIDLRPLTFGGTGSSSGSIEQPGRLPDALESGTLNAPGIAGLGEGVRFIAGEGVERIRRHELELTGRLLEGLRGLKGIRVHGPGEPEKQVGIVAVTFDTTTPAEAARILDERYGILCRAGLHCTPMAHRTVGTIETGALRLSVSYFNTMEEVDYLLECLSDLSHRSGSRSGSRLGSRLGSGLIFPV